MNQSVCVLYYSYLDRLCMFVNFSHILVINEQYSIESRLNSVNNRLNKLIDGEHQVPYNI